MQCCCASRACSCVCSSCPPLKESTSTRLMYTLYLFAGMAIACVMLSKTVEEKLMQVQHINDVCQQINAGPHCQLVFGYMSVYRVCLSMAIFFLVLMIFTINVTTSKSFRGGIHNGYWLFKFLILLCLCIGAFFVPHEDKWAIIVMYFGFVAGFVFIIIQLVLLVEFAYSWNQNWSKRADKNKCWYLALVVITIIIFGVAIAGFVFLVIYFTRHIEGCYLTKVFISANGILCVVMTFLTVLPPIQKVQPKSNLLQVGIVSVYMMYLTFAAASSMPDDIEHITVGFNSTSNQTISIEEITSCVPSATSFTGQYMELVTASFAAVFLFISVIYASGRTAEFLTRANSGVTTTSLVDSPQHVRYHTIAWLQYTAKLVFIVH
uniref:Serine incorporator 5-like n=1 Tax=Saccoglossus kowalevskii TaxID=10224 RepID=A0ABM0N1F5_SACKO